MKTKIAFLSALLLIINCQAMAFDLKSAIKGITGNDSTSTGNTISNALSGILSTNKLEISALEGSWHYAAPAISFKSENVLKKAGGAAAAQTVEDKIAPYYRTAGFDSMILTVGNDSTFTMKLKQTTLKGTINKVTDKNSNANFIFNFKVAGKINIGKMDTYVTKSSSGNIDVMFDVSKLITIVQKVGTLSGNSTITGLSSVLSSYDGLCAGFELKKQ